MELLGQEEENKKGIDDDEGFLPNFTPGNIPIPYPDNSNTVKLLLKTNLLTRLHYRLLGKILSEDEDGNKKVEKLTKPLMCEDAAADIIFDLENFVNEVVASGIYNEEEIRVKVVWAAKHTIKWIAQTHRKYQIESYNWRRIVMAVEQNVDAILKKAKGGATLETIGNMNQQREVQTFQQQVPIQEARRNSVWDRIPLLRGFR